jgi:hypothetical protein
VAAVALDDIAADRFEQGFDRRPFHFPKRQAKSNTVQIIKTGTG